MSLPEITTLQSLPDETLTTALDLLFEPSPALHAQALPTLRSTQYQSYESLIAAIREQLLALTSYAPEENSTKEKLHAILGSHPRLGEPKKHTLSAQSAAEQRRLQEEGGEETARRLRELNAAYEARFPGLKYVVFVNGRGRPEIMEDMRRRIERGDGKEEEKEAIRAICDIANDRARKLLKA